MASKLNIEGLANERKVYALGATNYIIQTTHSPICGWTVNIYDKDENPLITGISLLSEPRNLTGKYHARVEGLFSGDLFLLPSSPRVVPLTFYNFKEDGDWCLVYISKTEMDEQGITR